MEDSTESTLPARLEGTTQHYEGNGRGFGYPTANISTATDLEDGVYFGFADLDTYKHHPAIIFIGTPVTVGATARRVEAHLLDIADQDYYNTSLQLEVQHFHRGNQRFNSVDELLVTMKDDESAARAWFKEGK